MITSYIDQGTLYPCWFRSISIVCIIPTAGLPIFVKIFDYLNKNYFAREILEFLNHNAFTKGLAERLDKELVSKIDEYESPQSKITDTADHLSNNTPSENDSQLPDTKRIYLLKRLMSQRFQISLLTFLLFPYFVAIVVEWSSNRFLDPDAKCMGCYLTIPQRNFIIGGGVSVVFAGFIVAYKARKFSDPFGIMQEVKYVCIGGALSLILFQIALFYPDGSVSPYFSVSWLSCLTMIAAQQATCTYQVYKAYKDPRGFSKPLHRRSTLSFLPFWKDDATAGTDRKESIKGNENQSLVVSSQFDDHGGPSITSLPQELRLILDAYTEHSVTNHSKKQHSDALFQEQLLVLLTKFEEYLLGEFAVENLRMYLECDKWQRAFNDLTDSTRRSRARRIITLFVETDSMFYVNLPANIRDGLIDAVNNKDTAIHHDLFKQSQREMFHILLGSYTRYVTKNPNVSIHRHQQLNKDISP